MEISRKDAGMLPDSLNLFGIDLDRGAIATIVWRSPSMYPGSAFFLSAPIDLVLDSTNN
jgi:hypothetical protein